MIKNNNRVLLLLCSLTVVMTILFMGVLYQNGNEKVPDKKKKAIDALRASVELLINREFEKVQGSTYVLRTGKRKITKRQLITETGMYVVDVDSFKEARGIYSLETVGKLFRILQSYSVNLSDMMLTAWEEEIKEVNPGMKCALKFTVTPLDGKEQYESFFGDTTVCQPKNALGTYYVDDMYTTELTAYFVPSSFIRYVDWTSWEVMLVLAVWGVLICGLLGWILWSYIKKKSAKPVFQIGEYTFDPINQDLIYRGRKISCTSQLNKLLYAFVIAPDYFLSYDEIVHICGWNLTDEGLDGRRRTAIHQLNRLFSDSDACKNVSSAIKIVSLPERKGYQLYIVSGKK